MTIDEKLQHFYEVSLDEAREDAARAIQDHKDYLQKVLEEHKQSRIQTAEAEVKAETEHVRREVNKALSSEQITLKRNWSLKQNELKETLLQKLKSRVQQFTATPEYQDYLCRRIREAKDFAEDDEILIFFLPMTKSFWIPLQPEQAVLSRFLPKTFSEGSVLRFRQKHPDRQLFCCKSGSHAQRI